MTIENMDVSQGSVNQTSAAGGGITGAAQQLASSSRTSTSPYYHLVAGDERGGIHHISFPCSSQHGPKDIEQAAQATWPQVSLFKTASLEHQQQQEQMAQEEEDTESQHLPFGSTSSSLAVQKITSRPLEAGIDLVAAARRDGSIDLFTASLVREGSSGQPERYEHRHVLTVHEKRMRPGMERWVGLALGKYRLYSCTSAGAFRAVTFDTSKVLSWSILTEVSRVELNLASPLQDCAFLHGAGQSTSSDPIEEVEEPTHFAYGGEEVCMSLWHIETALSNSFSAHGRPHTKLSQIQAQSKDHVGEDAEQQLNSKQRKRKRQAEARAAARELLPGEVFRAKNQPNDGLGLPQRANIVSIAFAWHASSSDDAPRADEDGEYDEHEGQVAKSLWLLAGTKDGFLKQYHPSSGVRKVKHEWRVVPKGQDGSAIKSLAVVGDVAYAADVSKKVYMVDWVKGRVLGQLKGIDGSASSIQALPPPTSLPAGTQAPFQRVLTNSQDRLIRLYHTPVYARPSAAAPLQAGKKGSVREARLHSFAFSANGSRISACAWDGRVPACTLERALGQAEELVHSIGGAAGGDGEQVGEDGDEDEFDGMETVGVEDAARAVDDADEADDGDEVRGGNEKPGKKART